MAVYPICSCLVSCIIRSSVVWALLCHHQIAAHIHTPVLFFLSPTHQQSPSFPLLKPWVDPLYSAEPILYPFRHIFLPIESGPLMPRRPPPSPLRLVHGPLPPRGESKFTMPSVPRPIFYPPTATGVVRRRVSCDPIVMSGEKRGELAAPSRTVSR